MKSSNDSKNTGDLRTASDSKNAKGDQRTTTVHDGDGGEALAPNPKTTPKTSKATGPQDQAAKASGAQAGKPAGPKGKVPADSKDQTAKPGDSKEAASGDPKEKGQQPTGPQDASASAAAEGRPRTQDAREAGFRDGHRAARGVAQVRAYVDGTRDGYADGTEQAAKDKARLDEAHQDRKEQRADAQQRPAPTSRDGEQQPVSDTTVDTAAPLAVKGIDKDRVYLGDGAARESMTRGEVRSLKTFERRLKARSTQMAKAADVLKALVAYEKEQARQALALAEKARSVKGGEKLMPKLQRLAEAAQQEAAAAEEAHKRAVRAAESVKVLLANVEKRDGLIYKAVLDSPETMPAEMAFYQEAA
ncbi:hypothetical protein OHB41_51415 [Streptomyces sp. NBC_01571]|uniref:hypothetical protein n=1 Tax=Streptomyces sp. NBC_01571 TaxID=2975883 RepID=UPI002253C87C|nr:hypothetical protein [Streptomyces sp. NBC_01571]MCX4581369.1 hypothetical protein [Streptomyces sp. NBC_01571]